jgi:hypothetical protein
MRTSPDFVRLQFETLSRMKGEKHAGFLFKRTERKEEKERKERKEEKERERKTTQTEAKTSKRPRRKQSDIDAQQRLCRLWSEQVVSVAGTRKMSALGYQYCVARQSRRAP